MKSTEDRLIEFALRTLTRMDQEVSNIWNEPGFVSRIGFDASRLSLIEPGLPITKTRELQIYELLRSQHAATQ